MPNEHSKLPLWQEKSLEEKIETLQNSIKDLYVYTLSNARKDLLEILESYKPFDAKENSDLKQMKFLIETYPDIFHKSCEIGHLTGSALVIDINTGKVLLHRHRSLDILLQFGGHTEYEVDFSSVALREAQEESGLPDLSFFPNERKPYPIDIDIHTIPSSKGKPEHFHLDIRYLLATKQPNKINVNKDESDFFVWLSYSDVIKQQNQINPSLMRLITKSNKIYSDSKNVIK